MSGVSQRTKEGLAAARKRGKRIGRPPVLTDKKLSDARRRIESDGRSAATVARERGVKHCTLSRSRRRQAEIGD